MTIVRRNQYPATIRLAAGREIQRCRVVFAEGGEEAGLWAWQGSPDRLAYRAQIDWSQTSLPVDERAPVAVHLTDGTVVEVQRGQACSTCGTFARWTGPAWAQSVTVRL